MIALLQASHSRIKCGRIWQVFWLQLAWMGGKRKRNRLKVAAEAQKVRGLLTSTLPLDSKRNGTGCGTANLRFEIQWGNT